MPLSAKWPFVCSLVALLAAPGSSLAQTGPAACSCKNLESIQQDYQNAIYLEGFFRKMAADLKAWEIKTQKEKDAGKNSTDIATTGVAMYADIKSKTLKLPFGTVKGYSGPESVVMPAGTCDQSQAELDALEKGSPCEALADAALAHELGHRDICKAMGPNAYWKRLASDFALEEAERYKIQVANLKSELQRVLDVSDVRLRGEWMHTLSGQGVEIVYFYTFDSGKLTTANQHDGFWNLKGKGTTQNKIVSMKAPGVTCQSTGTLTNDMQVTMGTDGISFGLELTESGAGGDMTVNCGGGMAMAMPSGGASSGQLAAGLPLKAGDTPIGNAWADQMMALAESEGMSLTGDPSTSLSISCEAP